MSKVFYCCVAIVAIAAPAWAATYNWDARSGLWPYQVDPTMSTNYDAGCLPALSTNFLTLGTPASVYEDHCYVMQRGTNLTAPAQLVIEAELKVVQSAHRSDAPTGSGVMIVWCFGNVSALRCVPGMMWLQSNQGAAFGPTAYVANTDDFHRYRIEVDNPTTVGGAIRVYYDGALVIAGVTESDPDGTPSIYFGDGTVLSSGLSQWRSFRHNAATRPSRPLLLTPAPGQVSYWAHTNCTYQLQWASQLGSTNTWTHLGTTTLGDNSIKSAVDAPLGDRQRYYRIQVIQSAW